MTQLVQESKRRHDKLTRELGHSPSLMEANNGNYDMGYPPQLKKANMMKLYELAMEKIARANHWPSYVACSPSQRRSYLFDIMTDDILSVIGGLAGKYLPKVVDWIHQRIQSSLPSQAQTSVPSSGALAVDNNMQGQLVSPTPMSLMPSILPTSDSYVTGPLSQYSLEAVNKDYIASFIAPREACERRPNQSQQKTGLVRSQFNLTMTTNATGAIGLYVFPINVFNTAATVQSAFIASYNAAAFNPITGSQGASVPTLFQGPLASLAQSVEQYRLSTFEVVIRPITSALQEQGLIEMIYWQQPINSGLQAQTGTTIAQATLPNQSFYQSQSLTKGVNLRAVRIPLANDILFYNDPPSLLNTWQEGYYILLSGC